MKRYFISILLTMISFNEILAQRIELLLVPFEKDGKWGYVNSNDSIVVEPIYEEAYPTFNFRGRIKLKGKYGFINRDGKITIKPQYDQADDFKYGIALVEKRGEQYNIKTDGKRNTMPIALCGEMYIHCLRPSSKFYGIDTVKTGNKYMLKVRRAKRENGKLRYFFDTLQHEVDTAFSIGGYHILLKQNSKIALLFDVGLHASADNTYLNLNFIYDEIKFFSCMENQSEHHPIFGFKRNNKWGYIKFSYPFKEIIEPKYYSISSLEEGLALVEYEKGKFGYVNESGKEYFKREE